MSADIMKKDAILSINSESSEKEDHGKTTTQNANKLLSSEQENTTNTIKTEPIDMEFEGISKAGNSAQQNENTLSRNLVKSTVIKTEPLDEEYEKSMGANKLSLDRGTASIRPEPANSAENEPRKAKQKQKEYKRQSKRPQREETVIKFEVDENMDGTRESDKQNSTARWQQGNNRNLSNAVVSLERLDDDIVSALMPADSTADDDEVKAEPIFFEENFCQSSDFNSENGQNKRKREDGDKGSSKKKRKEVELIQRNDTCEATKLVWVKTSHGEVLRCLPVHHSAVQDLNSEVPNAVSRDAMLKKIQDAAHGSSFPQFSGYVPSGRAGKPKQQKTFVPQYQQVPRRLCDIKKKKRTVKKATEKNEKKDDDCSSEDDVSSATDSSGDEDDTVVSSEYLEHAASDNPQLNSQLILVLPEELLSDRTEVPHSRHGTAVQECSDEDVEGASSSPKPLETESSDHSNNGTVVIDKNTDSDGNLQEESKPCHSKAVSVQNLVYPHCDCIFSSWFEREEVQLWRTVVLSSQNSLCTKVENLGLLRFIDKNLFSFFHGDRQYVFLPELEFRGLLQSLDIGKALLFELLRTPLIAAELRPMSEQEMEFVEQYLWIRDLMRRKSWYCQMITPQGLHCLFQGLYHCEGDARWFVPAHSLFYQMKLGHHCRWSLQITPPICKKTVDGQTNPVVEKTLTHQFVGMDGMMVPVRDGGAGTSILNHKLSPSLKVALRHSLDSFHLGDVAKPFCNCDLGVTELLGYRWLKLNNIPFPHVTHVSFLNSSECLHCWKRPLGFYISVGELVSKGYFPPRDNLTLCVLLRAAVLGQDVCTMLDPERLFLTQMKMDIACRKTPAGRAGSRPGGEGRQELISQFLEAQHRQEEERQCYEGQCQEMRADLLINLIYLRSVYQVLAKVEPVFRAHAEARFYIKQWPHICPLEDRATLCRFALQDFSSDEDATTAAESTISERGKPCAEKQQGACADAGIEKGEAERTCQWGNRGEMADVLCSPILQKCPPVVTQQGDIGDPTAELKATETDSTTVGERRTDSQPTQYCLRPIKEEPCGEQEAVTDQAKCRGRNEEMCEGEEDSGGKQRCQQRAVAENCNTSVSGQELVNMVKCEIAVDKAGDEDLLKTPMVLKQRKPLGCSCHPVQNGQLLQEQSCSYSDNPDLPTGQHVFNDRPHQGSRQDCDHAESENSSQQDRDSQSMEGRSAHRQDRQSCRPSTSVLCCGSRASPASGQLSSEVQGIKMEQYVGEVTDPSSDTAACHLHLPSTSHSPSYSRQTPLAKKRLKKEPSASVGYIADVSCSTQTDLPESGDEADIHDDIDGEGEDREDMVPTSCCQKLHSLSFKIEQYPRTCTCVDDAVSRILNPVPTVQCFWNSHTNRIVTLLNVGQGIILGRLLFTFNYSGTLYLSLAQLIDLDILTGWDDSQVISSTAVQDWHLVASEEVTAFLRYSYFHSGVSAEALKTLSYLIPAEVLCFLSSQPDIVAEELTQSDIFIHKPGHLCADSASRAFEGGKELLTKVLQAWSKSASMQDDLMEAEERRMRAEQEDVTTLNTGVNDGDLLLRSWQAIQNPQQAKQHCRDQNRDRLQDFAIFLRRLKTNELEIKHYPIGKKVYVCSPSVGGTSVVMQRRVKSAKGDAHVEEGSCAWTDVFEGAMLPKGMKEKNLSLKTGTGFRELTSSNVHRWIGEKFCTHHLVLTGSLFLKESCKPGLGSATFSCFRIEGKLFVSWGEVSHFFTDHETFFNLAHHLQVTLYDIPRELSVHLYRHRDGDAYLHLDKPWICVTSLCAMSWLGILDGSYRRIFPCLMEDLVKNFQTTSMWVLKMRNLILLPKQQSFQSTMS